ncbi:MAG: phosphonate C-P lyase system protein PhnG [Burkholderiaceae bacterium]
MTDIPLRQRWLQALAMAPWPMLDELSRFLLSAHRFDWLRQPEVGLVMAQGRIDRQGDRFNLAEVPVTRCVVRSMFATTGVAYVLGRTIEKAGTVAKLDAMLQVGAYRDVLMADVVEPVEQALARTRRDEAGATAQSRVEFYTLTTEST